MSDGRRAMAYFRGNEPGESGKQAFENSGENFSDTETEYVDSDYDDGFDDPDEAEESELSDEELKKIRSNRFRVMSGAGNLAAVIAGTVAILALLALLMSMIGFVLNDADRNFTLFQTRF